MSTAQSSSLEPLPSIEQKVVEKLRELPAEKQQEVLDFIEFLVQKKELASKRPRRSLEGLLAHHNLRVTAEEIDEARREMWGGHISEPKDT